MEKKTAENDRKNFSTDNSNCNGILYFRKIYESQPRQRVHGLKK